MARPSLTSIASPVSPNATFTPRTEFLRTDPPETHRYTLVSFNGNEILRLANCPDALVASIRDTLHNDVRHFQSDTALGVAELVLAGRPFVGRSVRQEQVVMEIFATLLNHNFTFVSPIDYGRIYLDKLTLVFKQSSSFSPTPPTSQSVFGLSFLSTTSLRVVSPPLALTPIILQVVRSSWPHGVVSEKKDGNGCYTFKLKGYPLFKQSTFETDSLSHILTLLSAMDSHGIRLLSSVTLNKRSRIQDFWMFTAPTPPKSSSSPSTPMRPRHSLGPLDTPSGTGNEPVGHSMLLGSQQGAMDSLSPLRPTVPPSIPSRLSPGNGHVRSASNPVNNSPSDPHVAMLPTRSNSVKSGTLLKKKPVPAISPTPSSSASSLRKGSSKGVLSSPVPSSSAQQTPHGGYTPPRANVALPPQYPSYPPNTSPISPYPLDHQPQPPASRSSPAHYVTKPVSTTEILYTASPIVPRPSLDHNAPLSPSFRTPGPPPPLPPRGPAAVPTLIPPRSPSPPDPPHWAASQDQHDNVEPQNPHESGILLSHGVFRNTNLTSTYSESSYADFQSEADTPSPVPGGTGLLDGSFPERDIRPAIAMLEEHHLNDLNDRAGLANKQSPRVVNPDLPDVGGEELGYDARKNRSEAPLIGILPVPEEERGAEKPPLPPRPFQIDAEGRRVDAIATVEPVKDEGEQKKGEDTTSQPRATVHVPMTTRESDIGAGGPWVFIHDAQPKPGEQSSPTSATAPVPSAHTTPHVPPLTIPSDGDQSSYSSKSKSSKRDKKSSGSGSGFHWSRRKKTVPVLTETSTSAALSPLAATPTPTPTTAVKSPGTISPTTPALALDHPSPGSSDTSISSGRDSELITPADHVNPSVPVPMTPAKQAVATRKASGGLVGKWRRRGHGTPVTDANRRLTID